MAADASDSESALDDFPESDDDVDLEAAADALSSSSSSVASSGSSSSSSSDDDDDDALEARLVREREADRRSCEAAGKLAPLSLDAAASLLASATTALTAPLAEKHGGAASAARAIQASVQLELFLLSGAWCNASAEARAAADEQTAEALAAACDLLDLGAPSTRLRAALAALRAGAAACPEAAEACLEAVRSWRRGLYDRFDSEDYAFEADDNFSAVTPGPSTRKRLALKPKQRLM